MRDCQVDLSQTVIDRAAWAMLDSAFDWAISSVVERFLHTEEATGSIPVSPTILLLHVVPISPH